ncbi:MAG: FixH family protein [Hyphomonadaceae bacterium]
MTQARPLRGVHVLLMLVAFFGVMVVVDAIFLFRSIVTFPGEDAPKSYVQGLEYNATIAQREAQAHLGWSAQVGVETGESRRLVARLQDASGAPVAEDMTVTAEVRVHGRSDADAELVLERLASGEYAAVLPEQARGRVDVDLRAVQSGATEVKFEARKVLLLP